MHPLIRGLPERGKVNTVKIERHGLPTQGPFRLSQDMRFDAALAASFRTSRDDRIDSRSDLLHEPGNGLNRNIDFYFRSRYRGHIRPQAVSAKPRQVRRICYPYSIRSACGHLCCAGNVKLTDEVMVEWPVLLGREGECRIFDEEPGEIIDPVGENSSRIGT